MVIQTAVNNLYHKELTNIILTYESKVVEIQFIPVFYFLDKNSVFWCPTLHDICPRYDSVLLVDPVDGRDKFGAVGLRVVLHKDDQQLGGCLESGLVI